MNQWTMGWTIFVSMLGMMCLSIGNEFQNLQGWEDIKTISFIGKAMVHLGTVIGAFIGGKLIPTKEK